MEIIEMKDRDPVLIGQLVKVWRASVKATHLFLSDAEISRIEALIPGALLEIPHLIVAKDEGDLPVALMGIAGQTLEMLFLAPEARGRGLGRQLLEYGIREFAVNEVGVNEQNPQARGFYEHMGFEVVQRTPTDAQGMPYPILILRLPAGQNQMPPAAP